MSEIIKEKVLQDERIVGEVCRVIWSNEDNGYHVLSVAIDPVTEVVVTVNHIKIYEGITMEFKGQWQEHPRFGRQFKSKEAWEVPPSTTEGLISFLSSSFFEGIGPVKARRIVNHFKDNTYKILDTDPDRLLEVNGVSKRLVNRIKRSWEKNKEVKDIMIFLQGYNIPATLAVKIYEEYEHDCVHQIQNDPYDLIYKIKGIGFLTADKVALDVGFDMKSDLRVDACIQYVLAEAAQDGHTYLVEDQIISKCQELIGIEDIGQLGKRLNYLRMGGRIHIYKQGGVTRYFGSKAWYNENYIADKIYRLLKRQQKLVFHEDIFRDLAKENIVLSEEQEQFIRQIINNGVSILTGGPGTGKSFTTKSLVKALEIAEKNVILCAPTGRAAKRLAKATDREAKTIHRTLVWDPINFGFEHNEDNPLPCDFLIVDEASMVDVHLCANLLKAVSNKTQILFIGDIDQLPPVGPGDPLKDMIKSEKVPTYKLTKIFRQSEGSSIITHAHNINNGIVPDIETPMQHPILWSEGAECLFIDSGFAAANQPKDSFPRWNTLRYDKNIVDMILHVYDESIPKYHKRAKDIQVLAPMKKGSAGIIELNQKIQERVNPAKKGRKEMKVVDIIFREQDKVIQTTNNYDLGVYNGDIGRIKEIMDSGKRVVIKFDDKLIEYNRTTMLEVELAYAITIHKSQGSEFDYLIMPLTMGYYRMLFRNLIYTGLARAKKLAVFIGERKALATAVKNVNYQTRQTSLTDFLKEERI